MQCAFVGAPLGAIWGVVLAQFIAARAASTGVVQLAELCLKLLIFLLFYMDKGFCQANALGYTFGRQHITVSQLIVAFGEALGLKQAFVDQSAKHIVGFADTKTQALG